jgi:hypothetical protein
MRKSQLCKFYCHWKLFWSQNFYWVVVEIRWLWR